MTYPAPEPEIVRDMDWCDGPTAGLCRMGGVSLWFALDDKVRVAGKRRRAHFLYQISDAEVARIENNDGDGDFPPVGRLVGVWYEGAGVAPVRDGQEWMCKMWGERWR